MIYHAWRIEMLGELRAVREDKALTKFRSRQAALLLAYLALHPSRQQTREHLIDLLWPDDDSEAARNRLRVTVSSLRKQLEAHDEISGSVIAADRLCLSLRPEAFTSDVADFETSLTTANASQDEDKRISLLSEAVTIYRGELLSNFQESWVQDERYRLAQAYQNSLRQLVRSLVAQNEREQALHYAKQAFENDPACEESCRDLMQLYTAIGQPTAALQNYAELKRHLRDILQAEPSSSTQQMANRIEQRLGHSPAPGSGKVSSCNISALAVANDKSPSAASTLKEKEYSHLPQTNLPTPLTRFFGREADLEKLITLLTLDTSLDGNGNCPKRIVTLTGGGGAGKTRLAVETARRLGAGFFTTICFVPFADLNDSQLIAQIIASSLQLPRAQNISPLQQTIAALHDKTVLLVLDNLEHLVSEAGEIITCLLESLPKLECLATSRRCLGISGEQEFKVKPLPFPRQEAEPADEAKELTSGEFHELLEMPSIQLFRDRAQSVMSDFEVTRRNALDVAAICRTLEGLPLAIELAAARARAITPSQILNHLSNRFELLVNRRASKDFRHRSLKAVMEWSFQILRPEMRRIFVRLSVFQGGWTLQSAQAIVPESDILYAMELLQMDSLIEAEEVLGEMRFRMLETVRQFAESQLSLEDRQISISLHAHFFADLVEEAQTKLVGNDQTIWLDRLQMESGNLRAAYEYSRTISAGAEIALRMTRSLFRYWLLRGGLTQGREWAAEALSKPSESRMSPMYADALNAAGGLASAQEDFNSAIDYYEKERMLSREIGYEKGLAWSLCNLGGIELRRRSYETARSLLEESLALHRKIDNKGGIALALNYLAYIADFQQDMTRAELFYDESLALHRVLGDLVQIASALGNMGLVAERRGDYASARRLQQESLDIHIKLGYAQGAALASSNLGSIAAKEGDYENARMKFRESLTIFQNIGMLDASAKAIEKLAELSEISGC